MSKTRYMAVAQVEMMVGGKREYVQPGEPIGPFDNDKDETFLLNRKFIREMTEAEKELDTLRHNSSRKTPEKADEKTDEEKAAEAEAAKTAEAEKAAAEAAKKGGKKPSTNPDI